jgi:glycosyltransferase involved in cell wall biosynthesis
MIRVIHVVNTMCQGGEETLLLRLCPRMREFGVEPIVASITGPGPVSEELESHGVSLLDLSTKGRPDVRAVTRLWRFLRREGIDLVHNHSVQATLIGDIAGKLAGKPVVCTRHFAASHPRIDSFLYRVERFVTRHTATRVIAINATMQKELLAQKLARPEHIALLRNGLDIQSFRQRSASEFQMETPVVGTVGRLESQKAHEVFLDVVVRVGEHAPIAGRIVGDGSRMQELLRYRSVSGLEDIVEMQGAALPQDVPDHLLGFSLFLLTSVWEGLPLVLIEAAASGIPIVATDVGGVSELVIDGVTGFLAPVGDVDGLVSAATKLIDDPELAARMGAAARTHVQEHFDISILAEKTANLYREVLAEQQSTQT